MASARNSSSPTRDREGSGRPKQPVRSVRWRDWWVPSDRADIRDALADLLRRAGTERVEVACGSGRGRTGTALACLAVLDGVPRQRRYVAHFDRDGRRPLGSSPRTRSGRRVAVARTPHDEPVLHTCCASCEVPVDHVNVINRNGRDEP
ncbi:MAG: hypothetical protein ACRDQA_01120 [Nocardioidaceae bacterium]